ncbi:MAG: hypothetical protein ABJA71_12230, partial [Ginsengibacter sp.]
LMYHLLRKEGYQVEYFIYNEGVPINEVITEARIKSKGKDKFWKKSVRNAKRVLEASNVKYQFIAFTDESEKLITPIKANLDKILAFEYDDIHFGNIVKGVMYRFYKSRSFGNDSLLRANEFLRTALANYFQVKKLCTENTYKYLFFSHGIYCTWEGVTSYCLKNKIPFICYDSGKRKGTVNFNINQPSPDWSFNDAWEKFNNRNLSDDEEKLVDQYLAERELQKGDVYSYNLVERNRDINSVKELLRIKPNAKVITIFTNLIWDAANVARDIAFTSALDCIEQTIKYFYKNENVHILIRCHPAEKVLGTQERYGNLVRKKFNDHLPNNVTIIEPEMKLNSFTVIDISNIGVVNTSTVGLEFAMANKPILLISETNYRNKGFTYDVTSKSDYLSKINMLLKNEMVLPNQVKLARKYFYMMMFIYQKRVPLQFERNIFNGYTYKDFNSLPEFESVRKIIGALKTENIRDFIFWD